jgi:hypothetical protein
MVGIQLGLHRIGHTPANEQNDLGIRCAGIVCISWFRGRGHARDPVLQRPTANHLIYL